MSKLDDAIARFKSHRQPISVRPVRITIELPAPTPEDIEIKRKRILAKVRKRRPHSNALAEDFGGEERMQRLREAEAEVARLRSELGE